MLKALWNTQEEEDQASNNHQEDTWCITKVWAHSFRQAISDLSRVERALAQKQLLARKKIDWHQQQNVEINARGQLSWRRSFGEYGQ